MEMVPSDAMWPDFIKDKLCKIFNEIQAIESTSYPHTQYQNLNLWNEYQVDNESVCGDDVGTGLNEEDGKEEEEIDYIDREQLMVHNKVADDLWNDDDGDTNGYVMSNGAHQKTEESLFSGFTPISQD